MFLLVTGGKKENIVICKKLDLKRLSFDRRVSVQSTTRPERGRGSVESRAATLPKAF